MTSQTHPHERSDREVCNQRGQSALIAMAEDEQNESTQQVSRRQLAPRTVATSHRKTEGILLGPRLRYRPAATASARHDVPHPGGTVQSSHALAGSESGPQRPWLHAGVPHTVDSNRSRSPGCVHTESSSALVAATRKIQSTRS